jgi:hypothetical protein
MTTFNRDHSREPRTLELKGQAVLNTPTNRNRADIASPEV